MFTALIYRYNFLITFYIMVFKFPELHEYPCLSNSQIQILIYPWLKLCTYQPEINQRPLGLLIFSFHLILNFIIESDYNN